MDFRVRTFLSHYCTRFITYPKGIFIKNVSGLMLFFMNKLLQKMKNVL